MNGEKRSREPQGTSKEPQSHPKIEKVYWPGFENHPNHAIAKEQMKDFVTGFLYNNINCNQTYLNESSLEKRLLYQTDIMGRINPFKPEGLVFNIYTDGSVMKQYQLKQ